jgi:hypothetical protein
VRGDEARPPALAPTRECSSHPVRDRLAARLGGRTIFEVLGPRRELGEERSLVVIDDAAQHDAVAAKVAALVDAGETVFRVVAADEDVSQAIRLAVTGEWFDVVVLALSDPDPGLSRDVARAFGAPVLWIPSSVGCRAGAPDDGDPRWRYPCPASGTDVGRDT